MQLFTSDFFCYCVRLTYISFFFSAHIVFHDINTQFVYLFHCLWTFLLFTHVTTINNVTMDIKMPDVQCLLITLILSEYVPRNRIAMLQNVFNFNRQQWFPTWGLCQQYRRAPAPVHPCQCLVLSAIFSLAISVIFLISLWF